MSVIAKLAPTFGRIIVAMPSLGHVKALQTLLGDRISQEDPISWEEFHLAPHEHQDSTRLIFFKSTRTAQVTLTITPTITFNADEVFVLASDLYLLALRDHDGTRWGDTVDGKVRDSDDVFAGYLPLLEDTPTSNVISADFARVKR